MPVTWPVLGLVSPADLAQWLFRRLLLNLPHFQLLLFLSLQLSLLNITGFHWTTCFFNRCGDPAVTVVQFLTVWIIINEPEIPSQKSIKKIWVAFLTCFLSCSKRYLLFEWNRSLITFSFQVKLSFNNNGNKILAFRDSPNLYQSVKFIYVEYW